MQILFLTNNQNSSDLISWLKNVAKERVVVRSKKVTIEDIKKIKPDFLISFNYKHIIKDDVIKLLPKRAINLHVSYLPWNKGANPNLWSFLENTPKGVTIHLIDKGVDTGNILVQQKVEFDENNDTLLSTYKALNKTLKELFKKNWTKIKSLKLKPKKQKGKGSIYKKKDFNKIKEILEDKKWNIKIKDLKINYLNFKKNENKK